MVNHSKSFISPEKQKATFESQFHDINVSFRHAVQELGRENRKGSRRYQLEVDFAYVANEFKYAPLVYMPKLIEKMEYLLQSVKQKRQHQPAA